jgi:hypothetical protein
MVVEFALPIEAVAITLAVVMLVASVAALGPIARATRTVPASEADQVDA